jgi:hypothetical protein
MATITPQVGTITSREAEQKAGTISALPSIRVGNPSGGYGTMITPCSCHSSPHASTSLRLSSSKNRRTTSTLRRP